MTKQEALVIRLYGLICYVNAKERPALRQGTLGMLKTLQICIDRLQNVLRVLRHLGELVKKSLESRFLSRKAQINVTNFFFLGGWSVLVTVAGWEKLGGGTWGKPSGDKQQVVDDAVPFLIGFLE